MASAVSSSNIADLKDTDVHVTYEDQMKINKFARFHAKVSDLKEELKTKQTELDNLSDANEELELTGDDEKVPVLCGEVYVHQSREDAQKIVEETQEKTKKQLEDIKSEIKDLESQMEVLSSELSSKFGDRINLRD